MPTITTTLAGANFRPAEAREHCKTITIGEILDLETDEENEYDNHAVRVLSDGIFIGFVPKSDNSAIFSALMRGEEVFVEVVAFESALKPVLEITLP